MKAACCTGVGSRSGACLRSGAVALGVMRLVACLFTPPPASRLTPPMPVANWDRPSETEAVSDRPKLEALGPSHEKPRRLARINASAKARAHVPSQDRISQNP